MTSLWLRRAVLGPFGGGGWLIAVLVLLSSCRSPQAPPSDDMWRDHYVFAGDDGTVLALVLQRDRNGTAQAKAWFGPTGDWRTTFYQRFRVPPLVAPSVAGVLSSWSARPNPSARVSLAVEGETTQLAIRTPNDRFSIHAESVAALGSSSDPEGVSVYSAGRAQLEVGADTREGWLLIESTPVGEPRRAFVEFGDFVFVVAGNSTGDALMMKFSSSVPEFNYAVLRTQRSTKESNEISVEREQDRLQVVIEPLGLHTAMAIEDTDATEGIAPDGGQVRYEAHQLSGDWTGVAFSIRRE